MSIRLTDAVRVDLPKVRCRRCGYRWVPQVTSPKRCASCRSPYWKTDRLAAAVKSAVEELAASRVAE